MSVEAITKALATPVPRSSTKFVLVVLANCANPEGVCWPSIGYLTAATSQDRKTVMENIRRLKDAGFVHDTGERRGQTGQVIVYRLAFPETVPKTGLYVQTVPKTDGNSTVFPTKQYRFSAETVPKTGHGTVKEPSRNRQEPFCATPDTGATPPAVLLPLIDGTEFAVTTAQVAEWSGAFPALDVLQKLREMRAWLAANPSNRKTRRGVMRFCVGWLGKEQDKAPRVNGRHAPSRCDTSYAGRKDAEALNAAYLIGAIRPAPVIDTIDHEDDTHAPRRLTS